MSIESTVRVILSQKPSSGARVTRSTTSVFDALKEMAIHNIGALLVVQENQVIGIVTEREYARRVVLEARSSRTTLVAEIMQTDLPFVTLSDTARECLTLMTEKRVRHLPVYDGSDLVGVVSMGDIVNAIIGDQEFIIEQLTQYVTGSSVASSPSVALQWRMY